MWLHLRPQYGLETGALRCWLEKHTTELFFSFGAKGISKSGSEEGIGER